MSDTNRVSVKIAEETEAGTLETTNEFINIPFTGTSDMGATPETVVSDLIRSDRQVSDLIKVNESIGGGFDAELMPGAFDTLFEGVMQSTWVAGSEIIALGDSVTTVTATGQSITNDTQGSGWTNGVRIGDVIRFTVAGVEYQKVVTAINGTTLYMSGTDLPTVTSATDWTATRPDRLENGITPKSYTVERSFEDISVFEYMTGMEIDTFSPSASAGSIVTSSFGMIGRSHTSETSRGAVTDAVDESIGTPFNASSNVAKLSENQTDLTFVTELSLEITNNLRERNVLGVVGASSIGSGEFNVTGSMSVYFEDNALLEKLLNNTQTKLTFAFAAADGSVLSFHLPAIKFTEGLPEVSGKNEDVILSLGFQAIAGGPYDTTLIVQRLAATA